MQKIILGLSIGLIMGITIGILVMLIYDSQLYMYCSNNHMLLEYLYYVFSIVGVFITATAVVVALFGNEIKNKIFAGVCHVTLQPETFTENLGSTSADSSPSAQFYECTIVLSNNGSRWLADCELKVLSVQFKAENARNYKKNMIKNARTIYWSQPSDTLFTLREGEQLKKVLARIYPDNDSATPDSKVKSEKRLSITGCSDLASQLMKAGFWRVEYAVMTPEKTLNRFVIEYYWNGQWYARASEMCNCSSVKLTKL